MAGLRIVADKLSGEAIAALIAIHIADARRSSPADSDHALRLSRKP